MSWGEPQQPPYDPNNPYGQQPPYQQPVGQPQPDGQDPSQQSQPSWGAPQPQPQPPYDQSQGQPQAPGYTQPLPDPNNPYGQPQQQTMPFGPPAAAPYGQPGYGQQPGYTQPGYGQPGYGQPGYGAPEYAYPVAPPKKSNGRFVAIAVASVLVVGGGIAAAVVLSSKHSSTPTAGPGGTNVVGKSTATAGASSSASGGSGSNSNSASLSAPSSVQGLTELQTSVAQQAVKSMKSSLSADAELYPDPLLAAYNDAGGNDVTTILVDQPMSGLSASDQSELTSGGSASDVVAAIMSGAGVSNSETESTSASDGALSCGTKDESGTNVTICVWYDQTTFGTLQFLDGTSPSAAAPVADAVRAAAEG
jgi:hypothetical protein